MDKTIDVGLFVRRHFRKWKQVLLQALLFSVFFAFLELFFHISERLEFSSRFVYPIIFSIPLGFFFAGLYSFFSTKVNCILSTATAAFCAIWFGTQMCYSSVFLTYMEINKVSMAGQVAEGFGNEMKEAIISTIPEIFALLLITAVFSLVMFLFLRPSKKSPVLCGSAIFVCLVMHLLCKGVLAAGGDGQFSPMTMYNQYPRILDNNISSFGVMTSLRLELSDILFGHSGSDKPSFETIPSDILAPKPPVTDPPDVTGDQDDTDITNPPVPVKYQNIIDIDMDALIAQEKDKDLLAVHQYVNSQQGSYTNKYTGMFEGYNLIMICAESFSDRMISPELTPTLYMMQNNGFVFNNFYGTFKSITTNGEYSFCTGLLPNTVGTADELKKNSTFVLSSDKYMPYAMGNVFKSFGASTYAYHGNNNTYYDRYKTYPNIGYDYIRFRNGSVLNGKFREEVDKLTYADGGLRPTSDEETIVQSMSDYLSNVDENGKVKQFTAHYMTYSGHHPYYDIYTDGLPAKNPQTFEHRDVVDALDYNQQVKSYIACNLELEDAMRELLIALEKAGCLENTVIVISNDHYPYGLGEGYGSDFYNLAGKKVDSNFEMYENAFICYNAGMKKPVTVDTPCCTVDIIPTLLNLFGVDYDSRLLAGTDILDEKSFHVAMLYNQNFVTDKVMVTSKGKITYLVDKSEVSDEYIAACTSYVKNKFEISLQIVKNDYYKVIYDFLEKNPPKQ